MTTADTNSPTMRGRIWMLVLYNYLGNQSLQKKQANTFHLNSSIAPMQIARFQNMTLRMMLQLYSDLKHCAKKREDFKRQSKARKLTGINKTCWQLIFEILQSRGISKAHFCTLTGLGEEVYSKAEKYQYETKSTNNRCHSQRIGP